MVIHRHRHGGMIVMMRGILRGREERHQADNKRKYKRRKNRKTDSRGKHRSGGHSDCLRQEIIRTCSAGSRSKTRKTGTRSAWDAHLGQRPLHFRFSDGVLGYILFLVG